MDSSSFPLFTFLPLSFPILFFFSLIIASALSAPDWHTSCSTNFECGDIKTSYPFWGNNRVYGCGVPQLELKCQNQTTLIEINNIQYQVLQIDETARILKIAREDYEGGICQPEFMNTTVDPDIFEYASGYRNLTILYGCPVDALGAMPVFACAVSGSAFESGFVIWEANGPGLCYSSVYVPVSVANLGTAVFSSSILEESLRQGFEVKVKVDDTVCANCISSKGVCGYDIVSNQTTCYCPGKIQGSQTCTPSSSDTVPANPGMFDFSPVFVFKVLNSALAS